MKAYGERRSEFMFCGSFGVEQRHHTHIARKPENAEDEINIFTVYLTAVQWSFLKSHTFYICIMQYHHCNIVMQKHINKICKMSPIM